MYQQPYERPRHTKAIIIVFVLIALVVFGPMIAGRICAIQDVQVEGISRYKKEEVMAAAGIQLGQSVFSVNGDMVKENINKHYGLDFVSIWCNYFPPSSVVLTVSEHMPRAKFTWMGMLYLIGENGAAMEETHQIDREIPVPEITGMTVNQVVLGEPVKFGVAGQGEAIEHLIEELDRQGFLDEVEEINVSAPDNLILLTHGGMKIILGTDDLLAEKIAMARDLQPQLYAFGGEYLATLDVSTGEVADYAPYKPQSEG